MVLPSNVVYCVFVTQASTTFVFRWKFRKVISHRLYLLRGVLVNHCAALLKTVELNLKFS